MVIQPLCAGTLGLNIFYDQRTQPLCAGAWTMDLQPLGRPPACAALPRAFIFGHTLHTHSVTARVHPLRCGRVRLFHIYINSIGPNTK